MVAARLVKRAADQVYFKTANLVIKIYSAGNIDFVRNSLTVNDHCAPFADAFATVTGYVENLNKSSSIDEAEFSDHMKALTDSFSSLSIHQTLQEKLNVFSREAVEFAEIPRARSALTSSLRGSLYVPMR